MKKALLVLFPVILCVLTTSLSSQPVPSDNEKKPLLQRVKELEQITSYLLEELKNNSNLKVQVEELRKKLNEQDVSNWPVLKYSCEKDSKVPCSPGSLRVNFDKEIFDNTKNSITKGPNWKFVAPVKGVYSILACIHYCSGTLGDSNRIHLSILKNNQRCSHKGFWLEGAKNICEYSMGICDIIDLNLGDEIWISTNMYHNSNGLWMNAETSYISICRVR